MYEPAGGYSGFVYPHDPNHLPPSSILDGFPHGGGTGEFNTAAGEIMLDESLHSPGFALDELHHPANAVFGIDQAPILPAHLLPEPQLNWEQTAIRDIDEQQQHNDVSIYDPGQAFASAAAPTPDLLNLLHLPRSVFYDPVAANLGYPAQQTHLLRDLFHSLPQGYGLFPGVEEREGGAAAGGGVLFQDDDGRQIESPVFDYRREMKEEKGNFATEKHRRLQMNNKYSDLKSLIPNPTKSDRASIVMDAIDYIQELQRTVAELKLLIEKKFGRSKRPKTETVAATPAAPAADVESSSARLAVEEQQEQMFNDQLRSSWLQRRSRETFVDVQIIEDEVNIKLTQRKKPNCLLLASRALYELQLDVLHASGGFIGEHYIFMFNTKILQGSSVYAGAIAKKLLEVMEIRASPPYPLLEKSYRTVK